MKALLAGVLLVPTAVVFPVLGAALRERDGARAPRLLRLALAWGFGVGLSSGAHFVALVLFDARLPALGAVDGALVLAALALWWARRSPGAPARAESRPWSALEGVLAVAVLMSGLGSMAVFAINALYAPHGEVDAWMLWNLKARYLLYAPARWHEAVTLFIRHPDYPFLLPTSIAHGWSWIGSADQVFPIALAALFGAATVLLLGAVIGVLRGRASGLLASLCLLATPGAAFRATWLYADVPLAYFFLAALALLAYWDLRAAPRRGALACAGLAAGLAAWTKNEGILFLAAVAAARLGIALLDRPRHCRSLGWLMLGAVPPLTLLAYYKTEVSSHTYLIGGEGLGGLFARLTDPTRPVVIATAVGRLLLGSPSGWLVLALPAFVALMGPTRDAGARSACRRVAGAIGLVAAGYTLVFDITPLSLEWQLRTSLDRLLFHLWPSVLLAIFLWTASPTERATTEATH